MNFISRVLIKPIRYQSQQVFLFCKTDQKVYKVYAEKAMQMISDLSEQKTPVIESTHISNVAKNIIFVQPSKQEPILNFFLNALYSRTVNVELLKSEELQSILKYYPFNRIQLNIHIINQLKKENIQESQTKETISHKYEECFKQIIPKIKKDLQQMKARSILYKSYGKYLIEQNNIQKGLQTLQHSIIEHKKLIGNYRRKLYEIQQKKEEDESRRKTKIFTIKQSIRLEIQSMFQAMIFYYVAQKKSSLELPQKKQTQMMVFTSALIRQGMQFKKLIPHLKHSSIYYHKLRRIELELQYHIAVRAKDRKKVKKIIQQMEDFCKQCLNDLQKANEYITVMKEISLTLVKLKIHMIEEQDKDEELKSELSKCRKQIISKLQQEHVEPILEVVDEFIKKNVTSSD